MSPLPPAVVIETHIDALRDLRHHDVPVVVCTVSKRHPARATRFAAAHEHSPEIWDTGFMRWFEAVLQRYPGAVVIPFSEDDSFRLDAWRLAHPEAAGRIAVPPHEAFLTVTLKARLHRTCVTHGVPAPATWEAASEEEAVAGMGGTPYPVVLKPQTRAGNLHWSRGQVIRDEGELRETVRWALTSVRFRPEALGACPELAVPVIQEAIGGRDRPVYHVAGFLSEAGEWAALAHRKLLQFPRRFGNGLCFETAPLDGALAGRLVEMLRAIGFSGMFEAEFLERGDERLLIDLNPRPYNGMTLEIERGLSLPWYAYLQAIGDTGRLSEELRRARTLSGGPDLTWCRKLEFAATLAGQLACGGFTPGQAWRWARWYRGVRHRMLDPYVVADDRRIARTRLRAQLGAWARRPREFAGTYLRREGGR